MQRVYWKYSWEIHREKVKKVEFGRGKSQPEMHLSLRSQAIL